MIVTSSKLTLLALIVLFPLVHIRPPPLLLHSCSCLAHFPFGQHYRYLTRKVLVVLHGSCMLHVSIASILCQIVRSRLDVWIACVPLAIILFCFVGSPDQHDVQERKVIVIIC